MSCHRILHIDIAKGIGILLIVFGHNWIIYQNKDLFNLIYSFHVPLFFILSGVFFKNEVSFRLILRKKADSLLKPYFMTLLIIYPLYALKGEDFFQYIFGVLYAAGDTIAWGQLWFLPNLFLIYIFTNVFTIYKNKTYSLMIYIFIMTLVGFYSLDMFYKVPINIFSKEYLLPGLPFSADILLLSGAFFLIGFSLKDRIIYLRTNWSVLIISCLTFFLIYYFSNDSMNLNLREYDSVIFSTLLALLGSYVVIAISKILQDADMFSSLFAYIGANSLFVLIFHAFFQYHLMNVANHISNMNFFNAIFAFIGSVSLSLLLGWIISNNKILRILYLPIVRKSYTGIKK